MRWMHKLTLLLGLSLASISPVHADVAELGAGGFVIKHEIIINAPPEKVYSATIDGIGKWWDAGHTYSGDAKNLSIEARAGGCFCEKLSDGGAVQHMSVVLLQPGKMLRMSGALGPLQASGLAGSMTFRFSGGPATSKLELNYVVGGYMPGGFSKIAPAVNSVLGEQLDRLKRYAEAG